MALTHTLVSENALQRAHPALGREDRLQGGCVARGVGELEDGGWGFRHGFRRVLRDECVLRFVFLRGAWAAR